MSCGFLKGILENRGSLKNTRWLLRVQPSGRGVTKKVVPQPRIHFLKNGKLAENVVPLHENVALQCRKNIKIGSIGDAYAHINVVLQCKKNIKIGSIGDA